MRPVDCNNHYTYSFIFHILSDHGSPQLHTFCCSKYLCRFTIFLCPCFVIHSLKSVKQITFCFFCLQYTEWMSDSPNLLSSCLRNFNSIFLVFSSSFLVVSILHNKSSLLLCSAYMFAASACFLIYEKLSNILWHTGD